MDRIFREEGPRVLATLIRQLRDFELTEEVVHEAFAIALNKWTDEISEESAGWILTTARRRAIDRLRGRRTRSCKLEELARTAEIEAELQIGITEQLVPDDALRLIFVCCHPALSVDARVALTLRSLCGLTTAEIARAYLTTESTIAQRIVLAKSEIKAAAIAYRIPGAEELPLRLEGVWAVLYLVFNEGYFPARGKIPYAVLFVMRQCALQSNWHRYFPIRPYMVSWHS